MKQPFDEYRSTEVEVTPEVKSSRGGSSRKTYSAMRRALVAIGTLAGCVDVNTRDPTGSFPGQTMLDECYENPLSQENFFPLDSLEISERADRIHDCWYSFHLGKMGELSLVSQLVNVEAYRLLVLFDSGGAMAVRIQRHQGQPFIVGKKLASRDTDYDPGPLVMDVQGLLSPVEWDAAVEKIVKAEFWNISTPVSIDVVTQGIVLHGTHWVLEGSRDGKYRVVDIYSPEAYGYKAFKDACSYLLSLAGMAVSTGAKRDP